MPSAFRSAVVAVAGLVLSVALCACGGEGGAAVAPAGAGDDGPAYSLGLVQADPATLAGLTHIRHADAAATLPASVDLSGEMPPVGYQGGEGACAAWATAYAMRGYEARRDVWSHIPAQTSAPADNFSPAFVYNQLDGGVDAGISIPAALALMQREGAATLADMPYVSGQYRTLPSAAARADAAKYKLASFGYVEPTDAASVKSELAHGIPVVLAFKVYQNFFTLGANAVYTSVKGQYEGGHAVAIVGYDNARGAYKIINSWGTGWGSAGYGWISYGVMPQIALEGYSAIDTHGAP